MSLSEIHWLDRLVLGGRRFDNAMNVDSHDFKRQTLKRNDDTK